MRTLKILLAIVVGIASSGNVVCGAESEGKQKTKSEEEKAETSKTASFQDIMKKAGEAGEESAKAEDAKLSKKQQKVKRKELEKTSEIYGEILQGEPKRKRKAVKENLGYVKERFKKAQQKRKEVKKTLTQVNGNLAAELRELKDRDLPEEKQKEEARELKNRYKGRITLLGTRKSALDKEIKRLRERKQELTRKKGRWQPVEDTTDSGPSPMEELEKIIKDTKGGRAPDVPMAEE